MTRDDLLRQNVAAARNSRQTSVDTRHGCGLHYSQTLKGCGWSGGRSVPMVSLYQVKKKISTRSANNIKMESPLRYPLSNKNVNLISLPNRNRVSFSWFSLYEVLPQNRDFFVLRLSERASIELGGSGLLLRDCSCM